MKKVLVFATAALLISGSAFAGGKKCGTKECCKEKKETCCKDKKSKEAKEVKAAKTVKATKVSA